MKKSTNISTFISFAILAVLLPMALAAPSFINKCDGDRKFNKKMDYCFHVLRYEDGSELQSDVVRCIRYVELVSGIPPAMGDEYCTGEYFWKDDFSYYRDISKWQEWYRINKCALTSDYCDSLVISKLRVVEDIEQTRNYPDTYYEHLSEDFTNDSIMLNYIAYVKKHHKSTDFVWRWRLIKSDKLDSLSELIYPYFEKSNIHFADYLSPDEFRNIFKNNPFNLFFGFSPGDVYFIHKQNFSAIMLTDDDPYGLSEYCFIYTMTLLKNPDLITVKKNWYAFKRYNINFHLY